jgi:hypothetical protein
MVRYGTVPEGAQTSVPGSVTFRYGSRPLNYEFVSFCSGFKDANKQKFFPRFICLWVSVGTVHLHKSSKIKIYKEVTKL